jgi:hypothetical protein
LNLRRGKRFFSKINRRNLGPIQLPVTRVPGALPPGVKRQAMRLTTHFSTVSRLNEIMPLLLLYAFMAFTGVPLPSIVKIFLL